MTLSFACLKFSYRSVDKNGPRNKLSIVWERETGNDGIEIPVTGTGNDRIEIPVTALEREMMESRFQ